MSKLDCVNKICIYWMILHLCILYSELLFKPSKSLEALVFNNKSYSGENKVIFYIFYDIFCIFLQ